MNIFGIGLPEMAVIAAIGLLVFGPKRLPELGKTLGRTLRGFQSASQEFEKEFRSAIGSESSLESEAAIPAIAAAAGPVPAGPVPAGPVAVAPAAIQPVSSTSEEIAASSEATVAAEIASTGSLEQQGAGAPS